MTLVSGIDPATPAASGTRTYVMGLAARLPTRNVSVALVARNGAPSISGITYRRIGSGPSSARFLLRLTAAAPWLDIPRESIIHAQRPDDLVPFAFAKRRNPKVCTLHGIPALAVRRRRGAGYGLAYRILERIGLARTNRVIAVDAGTAEWYTTRYPSLAGRTDVVPVAVDTARFRPLDPDAARRRFGVTQEYVVAYAGRLSIEKRVDALTRAIRDLAHTELLVAGAGPEGTNAKAGAREGRVRFLGTVPHDDMPEFLNAADILVLPSEYEGMPTIAIEALACGTPVMATPVGGLPQIIVSGKTGWLVPDPTVLGPRLREALPMAGTMRDACVGAALPFSWDVVLNRILAVYHLAEAAA